ncbi:MAG: alginate export family protein, partial [Pseudomonadota bacterium]
GLYVSGAATSFVNSNTDLYYLGFRDDAATFVQGVGTETRHSFGARLFGNRAGWDWNWEGLYQFGSFGQRSINAWTLATETGFTVDHVRGRPRFGFSFNAASGDDDPNDTELGTFNPLFPRGNYFSEAAVLGPRNFLNIQPSLSLKPTNQVTASAAVNFFWRLETGDGVYTPSGQILRTPSRSSERFVGTGLSFSTTYEVAQNLEATAIYSRLFAGDFIEASGPSGDIDFVELTVQYKF